MQPMCNPPAVFTPLSGKLLLQKLCFPWDCCIQSVGNVLPIGNMIENPFSVGVEGLTLHNDYSISTHHNGIPVLIRLDSIGKG